MNICICDDELDCCILLKDKIKDFFKKRNITICIETFNSLNSFLNCTSEFDIIFMDIELQDGNALEYLKKNQGYRKNFLVIVTSHDEEALNGYKVRAFRFLTKPLVKEELVETLESIMIEYTNNKAIIVTSSLCHVVIKLDDIIYVEAAGKEVGIRTTKDFIASKEPLKCIADKMNIDKFFAPHRSYIVNFDYIKTFDKKYITMQNGERITISRLRYQSFANCFYEYIRRKISV